MKVHSINPKFISQKVLNRNDLLKQKQDIYGASMTLPLNKSQRQDIRTSYEGHNVNMTQQQAQPLEFKDNQKVIKTVKRQKRFKNLSTGRQYDPNLLNKQFSCVSKSPIQKFFMNELNRRNSKVLTQDSPYLQKSYRAQSLINNKQNNSPRQGISFNPQLTLQQSYDSTSTSNAVEILTQALTPLIASPTVSLKKSDVRNALVSLQPIQERSTNRSGQSYQSKLTRKGKIKLLDISNMQPISESRMGRNSPLRHNFILSQTSTQNFGISIGAEDSNIQPIKQQKIQQVPAFHYFQGVSSSQTADKIQCIQSSRMNNNKNIPDYDTTKMIISNESTILPRKRIDTLDHCSIMQSINKKNRQGRNMMKQRFYSQSRALDLSARRNPFDDFRTESNRNDGQGRRKQIQFGKQLMQSIPKITALIQQQKNELFNSQFQMVDPNFKLMSNGADQYNQRKKVKGTEKKYQF